MAGPYGERYFEDFKPGDRIETGAVTLGEAEMVDFARRYDPQPFHIDHAGGKASIFGGLIASGFLTIAVTFRQFWDTGALGTSNLSGLGFEEVKFLKPVRPGDSLHAVVEVMDARPSASRPDRGLVTLRYRGFNQRDEEVLSYLCTQILRRRPA